MSELFDVVAVNLRTHEQRTLAERKTEANADAICNMAAMRRGVADEFFKVVPHGDKSGIEPAI